ncbi:MAG: sigma-70 family RNA polymerase sigma factor [Ruthenibacterium sp.]
MAEKKIYQIRVNGKLIPVTKDIYLTYYRMKRRELHLSEKDAKHSVVYYSSMDTENTNGEDAIPDNNSIKVEDAVTDKLMSERLHQCLAELTEREQMLIRALFFEGKSEPALSAETGISQQSINYRKQKILLKLKKLMKN